MTSLVVGGAGFLGSHLVDALIARGENVVIIDNLSTGSVANLESSISSGRATFVYADVAVEAKTLVEVIRRTTKDPLRRIFHLASPASPEAYGRMPWETLLVNSVGTMSLIDLAREHGARMIYASTSEVYGDPLVHPQPETYFGNVNPVGPRACYDEGKRFGEAAMSVAVAHRRLDGRIVRFFNCYGPRMDIADGRLIPALLTALRDGQAMPIQGTGEQTRSMTYCTDAIDVLLRVADATFETLQPVNIGNDDERSILSIAKTLASIAGVPFDPLFLPGRPEDPQRRCPDISVARGLGWSPATSLEEGLRETYDWYNKRRLAYA